MRQRVIRVAMWALVIAAVVLSVPPLASAVYGIGWTPPAAESGRCWGAFCWIRLVDGATEVSWAEYQQPPPVVSGGPPIIP